MRRKIPVFWLCLTGTLLLTVGVIFLPRYFSRSLDMRHMNQVEESRRDDFSFLKPASNEVVEVSRAFQSLTQDGKEPILLTSIDDPSQISQELLAAVYEQAMMGAELGILPWLNIEEDTTDSSYDSSYDKDLIPVYHNWQDDVSFARFYSITYTSESDAHKQEILNFWYLNFSDGKRFDYSFIINAVTYQMYYAKIYNGFSSDMAESFLEKQEIEYYETESSLVKSSNYRDYLRTLFQSGCEIYYEAIGSTQAQSSLTDKIGIAILYYDKGLDGTQNVYIERRIISEPFSEYLGISMGFQDLIRWADTLL